MVSKAEERAVAARFKAANQYSGYKNRVSKKGAAREATQLRESKRFSPRSKDAAAHEEDELGDTRFANPIAEDLGDDDQASGPGHAFENSGVE